MKHGRINRLQNTFLNWADINAVLGTLSFWRFVECFLTTDITQPAYVTQLLRQLLCHKRLQCTQTYFYMRRSVEREKRKEKRQ